MPKLHVSLLIIIEILEQNFFVNLFVLFVLFVLKKLEARMIRLLVLANIHTALNGLVVNPVGTLEKNGWNIFLSFVEQYCESLQDW